MKLQHLAIGDRFEYEGKIYVKTGPITAASENGGQRVIPRSALLNAMTSSNLEANPGSTGKWDKTELLAAFDVFYQDCTRLIDTTSHPELATARDHFIKAIE